MKTINGCTEKGYNIYRIFTTIVFILLVFAICFVAYQTGTHECSFYSRIEMAEILRAEGYDIGDDNLGTKYQKAWDLYSANEYAAKFMTPSGGPR